MGLQDEFLRLATEWIPQAVDAVKKDKEFYKIESMQQKPFNTSLHRPTLIVMRAIDAAEVIVTLEYIEPGDWKQVWKQIVKLAEKHVSKRAIKQRSDKQGLSFTFAVS